MAVIHVSGDPNANQGFQLTPEGSYDLRIDSKKLTTSKAGNPQHELDLVIISADNGQCVGKKVKVWLSHSSKAVGMLREFLDAAGVHYEEGIGPASAEFPNGAPMTSFDDDHLVGKIVRGVCARREYQGKAQDNWKNWQPSAYGVQPANQQVPQAAPQAAPPQAAPQGYAPPAGYTPQSVPGQQAGVGQAPPVAQPLPQGGVPPQGGQAR